MLMEAFAMRIIFCDVDGVLNHKGCIDRAPGGFTGVVEEHIRNLKRIVDETGAKIVLSSDWRLIKDDPEYGENYDYLVKRLQSVAGLAISDHTDDISWSSRGDEIRKYLEDHPEITGYVILDDIPFTSFDACNLGDHLILTSERRGLTQKDADEAIRKLNGDMQAT